MSEKLIFLDDLEKKEKEALEKQKAINKASFLINDAKARDIKEKTRARSKKAAQEKDAILNSGRYDKLNEYARFEDIQESYGYDCITEWQRDELEALWEEREQIKKHIDNGVYEDLVTKALFEAWKHIQDLWCDEIDEAQDLRKRFDKQVKEANEAAQEWMDRQNAAYEKYVRGS